MAVQAATSMRASHRLFGWAVLVALSLFAVAPLAAQERWVPPAARKVSDKIWFVEGLSAAGSSANRNFISNAGFILTRDGVVVVDALGSPPLARDLLAEIAKLTALPVTHVIVTHYHADHIYGLQVFKAAGAKIIAHRAAREYLQADTARQRLEASRQELAPWVDDQTHLVPADEWIDGEYVLAAGGERIVVRPVGPAHTAEDLVVHVPSQRALFAGDLVFRGRIPFVGQADSRRWVEALDTMLAFDADVVIPGHGPLSRDVRSDMMMTRDYLRHLRSVMGDAARRMDPFDEAYQRADWSAYEHMPLFRLANRMNAYNTYLLMEREGL